MFKSLQIKIILIIMLVGIVMLAGFEYLMITEMKTLDITENIIAKNQQIAAISLIAYVVISFIIILFATKTVSKPINKLIESAKQIASGQDIVIEDRKEAIEKGISLLDSNDILLVLGKGHEEFLKIRERKVPFNDRNVVLDILSKK